MARTRSEKRSPTRSHPIEDGETRSAPEPTEAPRPLRSPRARAAPKVPAAAPKAAAAPAPRSKTSAGPSAGRRALRHLRPIALLAGVLACVYATVALAGYDPLDPSWSRASGTHVSNPAGPIGAWLADLLFQVLGWGAWSVVLAAGAMSWKLARRPLGGPGRVLGAVLLCWALLCIAAAAFPAAPGVDFPPGGLLGEISTETLRGLVGPAGTWIVLVGAVLATIPFVAPVHLEDLAARAIGGVEGAAPRVGRASVFLGRKAVGGVALAGAAVAGKVRDIRANAAREDEDEDEDDEENWDEDSQGDRSEVIPLSPSSVHGIAPLDRFLDEVPARPTAWFDGVGQAARPVVGLATVNERPTPTQVSGRALVEAQWEPTVAPFDPPRRPEPEEGEVRDTIPAVDMERSSVPLDLALLSNPGLDALDAPEPASLPAVSRPPARPSSAMPPTSAVEAPPPPPRVRTVTPELPAPRPGARTPFVSPGLLVSGGDDGGAAVIADVVHHDFEPPHLGLLDAHDREEARFDEVELQGLAQTVEAKLADFGVKGEVVAIRPGPVVTTFEYLPAPGIKISKISALEDDIAMALKAVCVRIVAPIPGKGVVGIEIPNKKRQTVWIRDLLASEHFRKHKGALPMVLGRTVEGQPYIGNLASMPHLLVGGTTGSGKSVGVNAMLLTMLFTRTPEEMRLILIDPKMLEFELYRDIPHLLHPVVTEPKLASAALKWACIEMDERYRILSRWGVRNITSYNKKLEQELEDWTIDKAWRYAPADWTSREPPPPPKKMPYIVIVIDELADLMMVAAKDVEESIIRIAQKARAAGIHLIVATQRPSVNVITGLIKANMPSRIAYQVRTKVDGRTILDQNGAESLLGKGDMLFLPPGVSALERVHGPLVSDEEVKRVTDFLREQGSPTYEAQITAEDEDEVAPLGEDEYDDLYDLAVAYVCRQGKASASMIQREFRIGYNRAARILEIMERDGVVGPADGARPREVLVQSHAS